MGSDVRRYQANLQDELNGAAVYAALAAAEADPLRKDLFLQWAQAEGNHAQLWRDKLTAAGVQMNASCQHFELACWQSWRSALDPDSCFPVYHRGSL